VFAWVAGIFSVLLLDLMSSLNNYVKFVSAIPEWFYSEGLTKPAAALAMSS
jgi:hypothetical protein